MDKDQGAETTIALSMEKEEEDISFPTSKKHEEEKEKIISSFANPQHGEDNLRDNMRDNMLDEMHKDYLDHSHDNDKHEYDIGKQQEHQAEQAHEYNHENVYIGTTKGGVHEKQQSHDESRQQHHSHLHQQNGLRNDFFQQDYSGDQQASQHKHEVQQKMNQKELKQKQIQREKKDLKQKEKRMHLQQQEEHQYYEYLSQAAQHQTQPRKIHQQQKFGADKGNHQQYQHNQFSTTINPSTYPASYLYPPTSTSHSDYYNSYIPPSANKLQSYSWYDSLWIGPNYSIILAIFVILFFQRKDRLIWWFRGDTRVLGLEDDGNSWYYAVFDWILQLLDYARAYTQITLEMLRSAKGILLGYHGAGLGDEIYFASTQQQSPTSNSQSANNRNHSNSRHNKYSSNAGVHSSPSNNRTSSSPRRHARGGGKGATTAANRIPELEIDPGLVSTQKTSEHEDRRTYNCNSHNGLFNNEPLEPAFLRDEDYPPGWLVYHPVLGVVSKTEADRFQQDQLKLLKQEQKKHQEKDYEEKKEEKSPDEQTAEKYLLEKNYQEKSNGNRKQSVPSSSAPSQPHAQREAPPIIAAHA